MSESIVVIDPLEPYRVRYYDRQGNEMEDVVSWARAYTTENKRVAMTTIRKPLGRVIKQYTAWLAKCVWKYLATWEPMPQRATANIVVSTVWLGIDHNFGFKGPPLIFETMVFDGGYGEEYCERYSTEQEALEGHERAVEWVRSELK